MTNTVYLPHVTTPQPTLTPAETPCGMAAPALALYDLIRLGDFQRRRRLGCDDRLAAAAAWKAHDMGARNYTSHDTPEGESPNAFVKRFGFPTSLGYGNGVESIAYGTEKPDVILSWLLDSPGHRKHIAGEDDFFGAQDCIGVGFCDYPDSEYRFYWSVLTCRLED